MTVTTAPRAHEVVAQRLCRAVRRAVRDDREDERRAVVEGGLRTPDSGRDRHGAELGLDGGGRARGAVRTIASVLGGRGGI